MDTANCWPLKWVTERDCEEEQIVVCVANKNNPRQSLHSCGRVWSTRIGCCLLNRWNGWDHCTGKSTPQWKTESAAWVSSFETTRTTITTTTTPIVFWAVSLKMNPKLSWNGTKQHLIMHTGWTGGLQCWFDQNTWNLVWKTKITWFAWFL